MASPPHNSCKIEYKIEKGKMIKKNLKLTIEEVKHIAVLARLKLRPKELKKLRKQLSEIIDFVGQLSRVETKEVIPTSQVTGFENVFREDIVRPSLSQDEALANAPRKHEGYFVVKAIFE